MALSDFIGLHDPSRTDDTDHQAFVDSLLKQLFAPTPPQIGLPGARAQTGAQAAPVIGDDTPRSQPAVAPRTSFGGDDEIVHELPAAQKPLKPLRSFGQGDAMVDQTPAQGKAVSSGSDKSIAEPPALGGGYKPLRITVRPKGVEPPPGAGNAQAPADAS